MSSRLDTVDAVSAENQDYDESVCQFNEALQELLRLISMRMIVVLLVTGRVRLGLSICWSVLSPSRIWH